MRLPGFIKDFFLNRFISDLYAGKYGAGVQSVALKLRGKKTWIGFAFALITAACVAFQSPVSIMLAPILGTIGGVFLVAGIIDKGSAKAPPEIPKDLRDALVFTLSAITMIGKGLNGVVLLAKDIGDPRFQAISFELQFAALVCTTITGFFATYLDKPVKH